MIKRIFCPRIFVAVILPLLSACSQQTRSAGTLSPDQQGTSVSACRQITQPLVPPQTAWPDYWLKLMNCVQQQGVEDNYRQAVLIDADSWQQVFRQSILFSGTDLTDQQRQQLLQRMKQWQPQADRRVGSLLQLWQDNQQSQLTASLITEKYKQLRQHSDARIARLRQQQQQLSDKRLQLQKLTDIEHQLSARKRTVIRDNADLRPVSVNPGDPQKEDN
ncbi:MULTISPECIES: hypothetical protein [unclassified Tatumella]|uniref:hypothetical protein n=1 Tax=unclassified Tatumella TaxID=2649542 RepID=UPI001BAFAE5D|nr:hypothetical protein [Tatumella sp. JGM16]MBS0913697.1 hypothetical protein [Tatumella sp. JGM91]